GCPVGYQTSDWNNGFTASVPITNTGAATIDSWTLEFAFPAGQQVTHGWSATWSQSGAEVTAENAPWNGTLAPGASVDIGFNGSHGGSNPPPTTFHLNDQPCATPG